MNTERVIVPLQTKLDEARAAGLDVMLCSTEIIEKVIALLKEHEAVVAHWDDDTGHWIDGDRNGIDPHTRITGEMIDTFRCSWCGF